MLKSLLKEDVVPTLLPVVEAVLTMVLLGSKRAVSADTGDVGSVNSDSILWRVQSATLVTSASENNGDIVILA